MTLFRIIVLGFVVVTAAVAQPAQRRSLRGTIDQCHAVQILDAGLPVDSLLITPPLPASTTSAMLMCMVGRFPTAPSSTAVDVRGDVGRVFPVTVTRVGDTLTLVEPIELDSSFRTNTYQLVIPLEADTIVVDSILTTSAWDGTRGGVIILHARSVLTVRGVIDVSALGFAGGRRSADGGSCGLVIPCDPATSPRTGQKGQSPLLRDMQCASGHTPWASGGGGGDAHNAGGGGGGNGGAGGRGGNQYPCSNPIGMSGMGGLRMIDDGTERIFLGGGGGGGHQNNSVATDGAAGGGIVMIRTRRIDGDTARIHARGRDVMARAGNDGAGAGGAGGTIRIEACSTLCSIIVDASGGRGGDCVGEHGPGGGGGGGRVQIEPALMQDSRRLRINVQGGPAGTITGQPSNSNGAQPGADGSSGPICERVLAHAVSVPAIAGVGDTLSITVASQDTTTRCECLISHHINLTGSAMSPLTQGTQMIGRGALTTVTDGMNISYELLLPSRSSIVIPFLSVLSKDTIIAATSQAFVASTLGDTLCVMDRNTDSIGVDVCGITIRQVVLRIPLGISARPNAERLITIELESALEIDASVRIYSSMGRLMTERQIMWSMSSAQGHEASLHLDASAWPRGIYFVTVLTSQGMKTAMLNL